jgi:hypothetical protein
MRQWPDEEWLAFHKAVKEIERTLGVSEGKAEAMLRDGCATEIRSQKQPYLIVKNEWQWHGEQVLIERHEWREHDIDTMIDSNGLSYSVDVKKPDFDYWLQHQNSQKKGGVSKQHLIHKLLAEIFDNKPVPDKSVCPRKGLLADLRKRHPNLKSLDDETLNKHMVTYNADPKRS